MTHWSRALVPPVPDDLPANLTMPLPPLPPPQPNPPVRLRRRARAPEPLLLADVPRLVRQWFSDGASLDLIIARLNERCPQQPRWTRRAVQKLLMATGRIHQGRPKAA